MKSGQRKVPVPCLPHPFALEVGSRGSPGGGVRSLGGWQGSIGSGAGWRLGVEGCPGWFVGWCSGVEGGAPMLPEEFGRGRHLIGCRVFAGRFRTCCRSRRFEFGPVLASYGQVFDGFGCRASIVRRFPAVRLRAALRVQVLDRNPIPAARGAVQHLSQHLGYHW